MVTLRQDNSSEVTRSQYLRLSGTCGYEALLKDMTKVSSQPNIYSSVSITAVSFQLWQMQSCPSHIQSDCCQKDCFLSYSLPPSTGSSLSLPSDRSCYFSFSKLADTLSLFTHCQDTDLLVCLDHNASYCYPHVNRLLQTFSHSILHGLQDLLTLN